MLAIVERAEGTTSCKAHQSTRRQAQNMQRLTESLSRSKLELIEPWTCLAGSLSGRPRGMRQWAHASFSCVIIFGLELHQARNELLGLRGRKTRS